MSEKEGSTSLTPPGSDTDITSTYSNGRTGPLFRLANVSKNLSIAPPVRLATTKRQRLLRSSAKNVQCHDVPSSISPPSPPISSSLRSSRETRSAVTAGRTSPTPPREPSLKRKVTNVPSFVTAVPISKPSGMTTRGGGGSPRSRSSTGPCSRSSRSSSRVLPVAPVNTSNSTTTREVSRRASEMKPKVTARSTASRSRNKAGEMAQLDPEEFWAEQGTAHWRDLELADLRFLRGLQEEQYEGYKHFLQEESSQPHARLRPPAPLAAARSCCLPPSFTFQLSARGSADEVFWRTVMASASPAAAGIGADGDKSAGLCEPKVDGEGVTSTDETIVCSSDGCSVGEESDAARSWSEADDCPVQHRWRAVVRKRDETMSLITSNHGCMEQNEYMYPKPLLSFRHLDTPRVPPTDPDNICGSDSERFSGGNCNGSGSDAPTFDFSILRSRELGKRGRLYTEVWDEADFLEKKQGLLDRVNQSPHQIPFRSGVLNDWGQILNNYSDDHDGVFLDLALERAHEMRRQKKIDEVYNIKKEGLRLQLANETEPPMVLRPPPVPVSCHHPAAWGIFPRRRGGPAPTTALKDPSMGLDCRKRKSAPCASRGDDRGGGNSSSSSSSSNVFEIDPSVWHPAAHSSCPALPVAFSSRKSGSIRSKKKASRAASPICHQTPASVDPSLPRPPPQDDMDDLSLHLDILIDQLATQSAINFIHLSNLTASVGLEMNLQHLRHQHRTLEESSVQVADFFAKVEEGVRSATAEASLNQQHALDNTSEQVRHGMVSSINKDSMETPASPPAAGDLDSSNDIKTLKSRIFRCRDFPLYHEQATTPTFLSSLVVGNLVEVRSGGQSGGVWGLATIECVKTDTTGALRAVQVRALGSSVCDVQWVYVEDGAIAPPGDHVSKMVVQAALKDIGRGRKLEEKVP